MVYNIYDTKVEFEKLIVNIPPFSIPMDTNYEPEIDLKYHHH